MKFQKGRNRPALTIFRPYIYVEHSRRVPESITCAAFSGSPWRFIEIPADVLDQSDAEQLAWVRDRVRRHYFEGEGKLFLFGDVTGYRWVKSQHVSIILDVQGAALDMRTEPFTPGTSSITFRGRPLR